MNKILASKGWWLLLLIVLLGINYLASVVHTRVDLTQEKRYTLSPATINLVKGLHDKVSITVLLTGDMPAGFKKLSNSTKEMLQEFKELAGSNIQFKFEKAGEGLNDTAKQHFQLHLDSLGLRPTNIKVKAKAGEAQEERLVYPGALVQYRNREMAIDLLQGQDMTGGVQSLNNAEALLEYKLARSIQRITADTVPFVGYLVGNGEPLNYNVYDLIEHTLRAEYGFGFVPIDSVPVIPHMFDALVIVKPTLPFTNKQKLKIDQYIMHGGKVIWLIDRLYAEMDSLMRSHSDFVAYDRNLNLDDQLFKYGVRINGDLVQDLQCDKIPLVVGNYGNQPQMQLVAWPYFPTLSSYSGHPIAKNLDNVLSLFPNSIDTIKNNIKKTILLATSESSRIISTPAIVTLNSIKTEDDLKTFNQSFIPVAVLLEGRFSSLYTNRLSTGELDTLAGVYDQPFRAAPEKDGKMIVVSDADIVANVVTQNEGPLPMGYNQFTHNQYANKDFFLNCVQYLTDSTNILETRGKDFALRLLDTKKTEEDRTQWQLMNIGVPVILVLLFGIVYQAVRKRKYQV
ncbi:MULTISPECIES: gliding motility-associated ABC transporter substrate-binding protein GldG [Niastella]|uniref:Gliding motility-associated ABC transporter substrate-binding protein GldG n=1 Tax=Niastella soli TaxID=2821487 RepID=A0ABS3YMM8_9BACT|nr:gliding motility-associated ABC transporter substrate-binding protein GldG [Niastella soli]MBO9199078.1 gliding motility-associated ABC transporter substrate-binding protein GldG [Niastella soli]